MEKTLNIHVNKRNLPAGLIFALLIISYFILFPIRANSIANNQEKSIYDLVKRVIPEYVNHFTFETIVSTDGLDIFEIDTDGEKIIIRGNTGVAKASGLNYYLEKFCNCQVSLHYRQLNLPKKLPLPKEKTRIQTPFKYRYIFNYCTYGYTMPWWNWERWEQMIDYMAMKGINMPLSIIGQEGVWREVYKELGLTEKQLKDFFVGPAHLPWGWMGNIDGMGGPLPDSWFEQRITLQKKILERERSLGMTPVLQGFTGHVPVGLKEKYPDAKIMQIEDWAGVPGTQFLNPTDPLFKKIGTAFIKKQTEMFGTDHLYDADCFIEVDPPSNDPVFLSKLSNEVYNSMAEADPEATWVLQGWFFYFQADFWKPEQGRGFFNGIPKDKAIVLDLYGEKNTTWDKTEAFFGQPWIWNVICNEDQKVNMSGPLKIMQEQFRRAYQSEINNNLKGIGVIPEGIGYNMVVQDFVYGKAWNPENINVEEWLDEYVTRRYGKTNQTAMKAWKHLLETVYSRTRTMWSPLLTTPHLIVLERLTEDIRHERVDFKITADDPFAWDFDVYNFAKAAKLMLECTQELKDSPSFLFDLTHIYRELIHALTHKHIDELSTAYQSKNIQAFDIASEKIIKQLNDLETITKTNEHFLLGKWLEAAQSWGNTQEEKQYYNWNARTIITIWQPWESGSLRDYSGKMWSGLISGYYLPRWELFINSLRDCIQNNHEYDAQKFNKEVRSIDYKWTKGQEKYPIKPKGDIIKIAHKMWREYEDVFTFPSSPGLNSGN